MAAVITGPDISVYQRQHRDGSPLPFDPQAVARAGHAFAIVRLGHGVTVDPWGVDSVLQLRAAGLRCSVYWYQEARHPAPAQRDAYLRALDPIELDFAPALDVEEGGPGTAEAALLILHALPRDHGLPLLYTMRAEEERARFVDLPELARCSRLWEAHWTTAPEPMACPPWDTWTIWQHDNRTLVDGIATPCDVNRALEPLW